MAALVSPIVDIILRLWIGGARHTRYLRKLQKNKMLLSTAMNELKEARDDVQRRVIEAEADLNEPKKRTDTVRGWLERVHIIEGEVELILQKADEQISRTRCLGGCCPPDNCWRNYKLGKSIAKKIPLVDALKGKGHFEEVTYKLLSFVEGHTSYLSKLQDNKILLRNAMEELKNVRNDVQRKVVEAEADQSEPKMRTDQVRGWFQSVEIIEGEVGVIMQTEDEQLSRAELLVMKKAFVDELKEKGHFQELTYRLPPPFVKDVNLESPMGMKPMFDEVWRLVTSTDKTVKIIGLYGQGGVGKTKLLQKINNEIKSEHGFDIVMFVVVSKPINYKAIQNKIGERLGLSLQGNGDEESRADKIFNALRNKNYVLLLDDIWEDQSEDQLIDKKRIGIPIDSQGSSKLIFTTRSERVCGLMDATHTFQVECLPWAKAWKLFQKKVGKKALNSFSGAREQAELVAKECGGLPLALITIGRAMSTNKTVQEWTDARKTLKRYASNFKDMRDKVLPRLKLSYDNLSSETEKSCVRYCALYPEDYFIKINTLIDCWIAEGILDGFDNNLDETRSRGHTIIGNLKSACLLENLGEYHVNHVKMHDVIRDLALWIVNECRSSDESGSNSDNKFLVAVNHPCKKWENAEKIFWHTTGTTSSSSSSNEEENPPTSPNLLTLIVKYRSISGYYRGHQSFFQHMPLLRVLDFTNAVSIDDCFNDVLISICELRELQYLKLSGMVIEELPVELRKLGKLKFLVLYNTAKLRRIPAGVIANLSELQVLDLARFQDWELEGGLSFRELDGLKQLQEVNEIFISKVVAFEKFLCNRKLQMVCTGLTFTHSYSSSSSSRRVLDLSNFKSLKDLKLNNGFSEMEELVLYGSNLETLSLEDFPKLNNIQWMVAQSGLSPSHFQSLQYIWIYGCHELKDLTWLVYVQNLKVLNVQECRGIKTIIELGDGGLEGTAGGGGDQMLNTGGGGGGGVFGRLGYLNIHYLPKLNSICRHALAFPSIEVIIIGECPELKKLSLGSDSNVNNTLKRIEGSTEWWNELEWEDETIMSKFLPYYQEESNGQESESEDRENSNDFKDRKFIKVPSSMRKKKQASFVLDNLDVDLTFHIGIDGGPSSKRKKKQARMR